MPPTPYSEENKKFSDQAHMTARKAIYPRLFAVDEAALDYEDQGPIDSDRWGALDGDMSIDRIVKVTVKGLRNPLAFTVQERFRNVKFARHKDITLTEWNPHSDTPSELYKISANYFLYGYYNNITGAFLDSICVNVPGLLLSIVKGSVDYERRTNTRSAQPFLCFKFDSLHKADLVAYHMNHKTLELVQRPSDLVRRHFLDVPMAERLQLVHELLGKVLKVDSA